MRNRILTFVLLWIAYGSLYAQQKPASSLLPAEQEITLKYGADRLGKRHDPDMELSLIHI